MAFRLEVRTRRGAWVVYDTHYDTVEPSGRKRRAMTMRRYSRLCREAFPILAHREHRFVAFAHPRVLSAPATVLNRAFAGNSESHSYGVRCPDCGEYETACRC